MGRRAQGAAHRGGARRSRRGNPRARSREEELAAGTRERKAGELRVRRNVSTDREKIEVPTRHEEVSVERVPLSGETSEAEIGEDEVVVPVKLYKIDEAYFVVDGHHRVSVARYHDVPTVEAAVSEFHPKLPAAPVPEAAWGVATYRGLSRADSLITLESFGL
jgi:uncharacterized protein (TIGR02271 family)